MTFFCLKFISNWSTVNFNFFRFSSLICPSSMITLDLPVIIFSAPSNFSCIYSIANSVITRTTPTPKVTQIFLFVTGWMSNVPIAIIKTVWATVICETDFLPTIRSKIVPTTIISAACQIKFKSIDVRLLFQCSLPSRPLVMQKQRRKCPSRLRTRRPGTANPRRPSFYSEPILTYRTEEKEVALVEGFKSSFQISKSNWVFGKDVALKYSLRLPQLEYTRFPRAANEPPRGC